MNKSIFYLIFIFTLSCANPFIISLVFSQQAASSPEASSRYNAIASAAKGEFSEAEAQFKINVKTDKDDNTSRSALGLLNDLKENKISKDYALLIFNGILYMVSGQPEQAATKLEEAIQTDPHYAKAYNILGMIYASIGELQKSIEQLRKAIEADPDYAEAYFNLGALMQAQGDTQQALNYYQKSVQKAPDSVENHLTLGRLYASLGRYQEAIVSYQTALRIDPDNADSYYNMGLAYFMMEDLLKSRENLIKAKKLYIKSGNAKGVEDAEKYLEKYKAIEEKLRKAK
jgi:tetratricopeptide (TPR) repeat protein